MEVAEHEKDERADDQVKRVGGERRAPDDGEHFCEPGLERPGDEDDAGGHDERLREAVEVEGVRRVEEFGRGENGDPEGDHPRVAGVGCSCDDFVHGRIPAKDEEAQQH